MGVVVAMDGPSGSGKSSTSRGRRRRAGAALPRHRRDVPRDDLVDARATASTSRTPPRSPPGSTSRCWSPAPTRRPRRSPSTASTSPRRSAASAVTAAVSAVSAVPEVRARLLRRAARRRSATAASSSRAATSAPRWPPTPTVKVYLTADPSARATRRAAEQCGADVAATAAGPDPPRHASTPGRAASPLTMAADARPHRHHAVHAGRGRGAGRRAGAGDAGLRRRVVGHTIRLPARRSGTLGCHPQLSRRTPDDRARHHPLRGDRPRAGAGRGGPPQRRQVDAGQPDHRPPRGGRRRTSPA